MSSLIIEVDVVDKVEHHPNADKLDIVTVKGWEVITGRDQFKAGEKCVYVPPDSIVSGYFADRYGIRNYVHKIPNYCVKPGDDYWRIRVANLRGRHSFGFVFKPCVDWPVGTDVASHYDISKLEIVEWSSDKVGPDGPHGNQERPNPFFHQYFDMENGKNFRVPFMDGDEVYVSEKVHGMNLRIGLITERDSYNVLRWTWAAGSNNVRRKQFDQNSNESEFWKPLNDNMKFLLCHLANANIVPEHVDNNVPVDETKPINNVLVFGERYGNGVQDMKYGLDEVKFAAFDIAVNGQYLDFHTKMELFNRFGIPTVNILYVGKWDRELIMGMVDGPTTMCKEEDNTSAFKGREGIVVNTCTERQFVNDRHVKSRNQFKFVSFGYLNRKKGTELH